MSGPINKDLLEAAFPSDTTEKGLPKASDAPPKDEGVLSDSLLADAFAPPSTGQAFREALDRAYGEAHGVTEEDRQQFVRGLPITKPETPTISPELVAKALAVPKPAAEHTGQHIVLTPEELETGIRRKPLESRRAYLERTAADRKLIQDLTTQQANQSTIGSSDWWTDFKRSMSNMRLFSGGRLVSTSQTPGGIDIGGAFRMSQQLLSPTVGEALFEGHFDNAFDNFIEITKGFGKGLTDPLISMPAKLMFDLTQKGQYLLPEERAQFIRTSLANYAGIFAGLAAGSVYASTRTAALSTGIKTLESVPSAELVSMATKQIPGAVRARLTRGAVEGAFGGAVTGFIETPSDENRADLMASYALMALPLGAVLEGALGKHRVFTDAVVAKKAADLYRLRQLQVSESMSADRAVATLFSLADKKDMAAALIAAGNEVKEPAIITGLTENELREAKLVDLDARKKDIEARRRIEEEVAPAPPFELLPTEPAAPSANMMTVTELKQLADPNVPLDKIREQERPYLDNLKANIEKEGFNKPIVLRNKPGGGLIIEDGHHRLAAAEELGLDNLPVRIEEGVPTPNGPELRAQQLLTPEQVGNLTREQELTRLLNKTRAELREARQERRAAQREALSDPLIPSINGKRAWEQARSRIESDPNLSVVQFDFNNFKKLNDRLGHNAGDAALKRFGATLSGIVKDYPNAQVFRTGGDEFVVSIPNENARAIRARIENASGQQYGNIHVDASGGIGQTLAESEAELAARKKAAKLNQAQRLKELKEAVKPRELTGPGVFPRPDGKYDLLIHPLATQEELLHFERTGFLPRQIVSFLGRNYLYTSAVRSETGELISHLIQDRRGNHFEVPWDRVQRGPDQLLSPFDPDQVRTENALYREFKRFATDYFDQNGKANGNGRSRFIDVVRDFANDKGIKPDQLEPFAALISDKLGHDLRMQALDPKTNGLFERLYNESEKVTAESAKEIADLATATGITLERRNGTMLLRDRESGEVLLHTNSPNVARDFMNRAGVPGGPSLFDGGSTGGALPPTIGEGLPGVPPPGEGPIFAPFRFRKDGPLRQFTHWFNTTFLGMHTTGTRQIMISFDAQNGTNLVGEVWHPTQRAVMAKHGAAYSDIKRVAGYAELARNMNQEELDHVTTLLETMAPDDIVRAKAGTGLDRVGLFTRGFTDREIAGAQWFIDNQIDIKKAYAYRRALINLERKIRDPEVVGEAVKRLQATMNVDENHVEAARIIGRVLSINKPDELSIFGIVRLANAVMGDELSPRAYIEKHGLKPNVIELAQKLRDHFEELGPKFDIPEEAMLGGYLPHFRDYADDVPIMSNDNVPVFVSELLRTGELSEYDRDPINVIMRYINLGYNNKYIKDAWSSAQNYLNRATARNPNGEYVRRVIQENYLNELRGIPHDASKLSQSMMDGFLNRLGVELPIDVRRDLVNTVISLTSSATIGFRPMQGLRDFQNFVSIFYSRFGTKRTTKMLSMIARTSLEELQRAKIVTDAVEGESVPAALQREGVIPTLSPITVLTPQERLRESIAAHSTRARMALQATGEAGIKWGLQHNVYQWAHAASYLEGYATSLRVINDLVSGKYGDFTQDKPKVRGLAAKEAAYDELKMNQYDRPVAMEFDRLINEGRFEDAAKFLAYANSFETVSVFGLANHPIGWGTNGGRLLGQFGSWPVWARSQIGRMAVRGSLADRAGALSRFAMTQAALKGASVAFGLNLSSWYLPMAAPAFGAAASLSQAVNEYDDQKRLQLVWKALLQGTAGEVGSGLFTGGPAAGYIKALADLGDPYDNNDAEAIRQLSRLWMLGVPGSFMARDVIEGAKLAAAGYNPLTALARVFSIRALQDPSLLNPYGVEESH